jgi:hypothetical protein
MTLLTVVMATIMWSGEGGAAVARGARGGDASGVLPSPAWHIKDLWDHQGTLSPSSLHTLPTSLTSPNDAQRNQVTQSLYH